MMEESLESRVARLIEGGGRIALELRRAIVYADVDPKSSLTKSRIILEIILNEIYGQEIGSQPKGSMIASLLKEKQFAQKIDKRILVRMNSVREMGNLGPHDSGTVLSEDAKRVILDLCDIIEWYQNTYKKKSEIIPKKYLISESFSDKILKVEKVFVPPQSFALVRRILEAKELIIILGVAHIGKTSLALYLGNLLKKNKIVREFIIFPKDGSIDELNGLKDIVILFDDPFGGSKYNPKLSFLGDDFDWVREFSFRNGNYVIITSRKEIFDEALDDTKLGERNDLQDFIVNISPNDYSIETKEKILYNHLDFYNSSERERGLVKQNKEEILKSLDFPHSYQIFVRDGSRRVLEGEKLLVEVLQEAVEIEKVISRWFASFYNKEKESFYFLFTLALFPDNTPENFFQIHKLVTKQIRIERCLNISSPEVYDLSRFLRKTAPYITFNYTLGFDHPSYRDGIISKIKEDYLSDLVAIVPCCELLGNDNNSVLRNLAIMCLQEIGSILPDKTIPILKKFMIDDWRRELYAGNALYELGKILPDKVIPIFQELIKHDNSAICDEAQSLLGKVAVNFPNKVLPTLLHWVENESKDDIKIRAISCLETILTTQFTIVWSNFEEWSRHDDWVIRRMVALCLRNAVKKYPKEIVPVLTKLSSDKEWLVKRAADFVLDRYYLDKSF